MHGKHWISRGKAPLEALLHAALCFNGSSIQHPQRCTSEMEELMGGVGVHRGQSSNHTAQSKPRATRRAGDA